MYIYIATAFISLILIKISLVLCKKNKILSIVFEILALTIPCVIAALRDYSVGTDVLFYQKPYFDDALYSDNLLNYLHTEGHNVEQLYFLLTWVCAKLSNRMSLLFFCIEALIIVPVYISLKMYMKKDNDLILGIFIFFTFWYNCSLNMARQSIALAFCILTFACLEQNKNKKAILFTIIAFLFHSSAIFMIPALILYFIMKSKIKIKYKILIIWLISLIIVAFLFCFKEILNQSLNFFKEGTIGYRYANYVNKYSTAANFQMREMLWCIIFIIITIKKKNSIENYTDNYYFYLLCIILTFLRIIF